MYIGFWTLVVIVWALTIKEDKECACYYYDPEEAEHEYD